MSANDSIVRAAADAVAAAPAPAFEARGHIYQGSCPDDLNPDARDPECEACRVALPAPQQEARDEAPMTDPRVEDLAALVRRLARALDKPNGNTLLARKAMDYLTRNGLQGTPLRAALTAPASGYMLAAQQQARDEALTLARDALYAAREYVSVMRGGEDVEGACHTALQAVIAALTPPAPEQGR